MKALYTVAIVYEKNGQPPRLPAQKAAAEVNVIATHVEEAIALVRAHELASAKDQGDLAVTNIIVVDVQQLSQVHITVDLKPRVIATLREIRDRCHHFASTTGAAAETYRGELEETAAAVGRLLEAIQA